MQGLLVFVPLAGYAALWLLGSALFLFYFKLFRIEVDLRHTLTMIQKLPAALAIVTVPVCSLVAFYLATAWAVPRFDATVSQGQLLKVGGVSLAATIAFDLLITVLAEKIDIRRFPVNLMYLFAWLVIVPAVLLAR